MADIPIIRINSPNVHEFWYYYGTPPVTEVVQDLSHISCVSIEQQHLKVWRYAIMDHLMTCQTTGLYFVTQGQSSLFDNSVASMVDILPVLSTCWFHGSFLKGFSIVFPAP